MPAPPDRDETREFPRLRPTRAPGAGPTLADSLRETPVAPLPWAVWIARQAADQLDQAHRLGVVHGRVSLTAFTIIDTPLGPELVLDVDPSAPRSPTPLGPFLVASDLWALGEVLYQLITGAPPPFDPLGERVPLPRRPDGVRLPDLVSGVVMRLLSHTPQERPRAAEVAFALARAERELSATNDPGLCWKPGSLVVERYRLLREEVDRSWTMRFLAADERDRAPRRLLRLAPGVNQRGRPLIEAEWERLRPIADAHLERLVEVVRGEDGDLFAVTAPPDAPFVTAAAALEDGPLPLLDARVVLAGVARGLAALHAAGAHFSGLVADDVALLGDPPTSAMIVNACAAAADRISETTRELQLHQVGAVLTEFAPEVLQGARTSARSDLYDLGCVAYQLLTGRGPFEATSGIEAVKAHLLKTPPRLTGVPSDVADLVAALLEKDPARRPESAAAVADALELRD